MSTEITIPEGLNDLDKSIYVARHLGQVMDILRPLVYAVYEKELWRQRFSSFGEYVESPEGLGMSQGYASKLKQTHEYYVIENNVDPKLLSGIDNERLYAATKLPGTPEQQVEMARVLSRREIKETRNDAEPHEHEPVLMCGKCHLRL